MYPIYTNAQTHNPADPFLLLTQMASPLVNLTNSDGHIYVNYSDTTVGLVGPQGAQGAAGAQGVQGFTGVHGSTGATGPAGPDESNGSAGPQGFTGPQGVTGAQGVAGAFGGPQGLPGPQGFTGAQGPSTIPPSSYIDFANQWKLITTGSNTGFTSVAVSDTGQYQTAATNGDHLFTSSTYGNTWNSNSLSPHIVWSAVAMSYSGQYQAAASDSSGVYLSSDTGATWTAVPDLSAGFTDVAVSATGQYMVACSDAIYVSSNNGATWSDASAGTQRWTSVAISGNGQYLIGTVDSSSSVYMSADFGASWTSHAFDGGDANAITASAISMSGQFQLVAAYYNFFVSTDFGETWSAPDLDGLYGLNNFMSCRMSGSGQYMIAAAINYGMAISSDYGLTWRATGPTTNMNPLGMSAQGGCIAAACNNNMYISSLVYPSAVFGTYTSANVIVFGNSANISLDPNNTVDVILVWTLGSGSSVVLPEISTLVSPNRHVKLAIADNIGVCGTRPLTIYPSGSDTIAGAASLVVNTNYQVVTLLSNGAGVWLVA